MLTSAKHDVTATPWQQMRSSKSVDLIGPSKFLPWRQLNGHSMTRPFISVKGVAWETRVLCHTIGVTVTSQILS